MELETAAGLGKLIGGLVAVTVLASPVGLLVGGGMCLFGRSSWSASLVFGIAASVVAGGVVTILWRA
ncbi:hypothetical protein [Oceanicella sp. SM1341]|uniref:hypothetical protein n=1 Tax=Oceanicella sp. SM1341 TaxID=1548889 RepID=UPI000E49F1FF|nr:hypothetical protein [Oceanicella sp. SM1341]